jgi:hypothetical protein
MEEKKMISVTKNEELAMLLLKYPETELIAMVSEDTYNGDHHYSLGDIGKPRYDRYCEYGDKVYFQSDISYLEEDIKENIYYENEDQYEAEGLTDDEIENELECQCKKYIVLETKWKECIVVYVDA